MAKVDTLTKTEPKRMTDDPPVRLSALQAKCLSALALDTRPDGERCVGFAPIERKTGLSRKDIKRSVRALARKGFAEFHKGLCTEDGEFAGSGYCITHAGLMAVYP